MVGTRAGFPPLIERPDAAPQPERRPLALPVSPLWVAVTYLVAAALWILFSDKLVYAIWSDGLVRQHVSIAKGWLFVLVTAGLLYGFTRRSMDDLRSLGAEMASVIDSMADAVLLVDASGRVVRANLAAASLYGVSSPSELVGPYSDVLERFDERRPDGKRVTLGDSIVMRALAGEAVRGEVTLRRADGGEVYASVISAPTRFQRGVVSLSVAVLRDMSERRRFEAMRDEFLQVAAHEFKTPLAVVKAYVQLLEKRGEGSPPALQAIDRQIDRLARLTQQLLQVSRLRVGGPELRRERYDLAEQVGQVADRFRRSAPSHPLRVAPAPPALVLADREQIEQVLLNLLDNAVKFSPRGGDIEIEVARRAGEAVVIVRDHGLGIPREKQERVFERFYRAHAGGGDDYGGIGVGLDTSREVVLRHGGRMWFESEEGAGSVFFFSLAMVEAHAVARAG